MAKRRKLEVPDPADLADFEERFRRETRSGAPAAPIGAMAADSASAADLRDETQRAEAERTAMQAAAFALAQEKGLVLREVPLDQIDETFLVRDRSVIDAAELMELRDSISRNGMRLPIEIFEIGDAKTSDKPFGLLSGYRRLMAVRELYKLTERESFATIKAVLRDPDAMGGRFAAMVEENEVRADLSHFERGRIAVIAAGQGGFANVEAAVDALFGAASKAKRSKVRSFALIFEELGDLLSYPEEMTEKQGLRLAGVLRNGGERSLRDALAGVRAADFAEEWALMVPVIEAMEGAGETGRPNRGGRPRGRSERTLGKNEVELDSGIVVGHERRPDGYVVTLRGAGLDDVVLEGVIAQISRLLSRP